MRVNLMVTCLVEGFRGEVGQAVVECLERLGCEVECPDGQTCCGQPQFNSGDWQSASRQYTKQWQRFSGGDIVPLICPSASCAAMLRHGSALMGAEPPGVAVFEFAEFVVARLEAFGFPGSGFPSLRTVAFHSACHRRMLQDGDAQERLLAMIPGLRIVPFAMPEQCCGFGGRFSIDFEKLSVDIGRQRLASLPAGVTEIVSGDLGCLLHMESAADQAASPIQFRHIAQLLREAMA